MSEFINGASYLISDYAYDAFIASGEPTLGHASGSDTVVWVSPTEEIDRVLREANGNPREKERLLGLSEGSLGDNPVRVNINGPNSLDIGVPDINTPGANDNWVPGGATGGGVQERVIYNCKNPEVYPEAG